MMILLARSSSQLLVVFRRHLSIPSFHVTHVPATVEPFLAFSNKQAPPAPIRRCFPLVDLEGVW